jgi:hypothetical protein
MASVDPSDRVKGNGHAAVPRFATRVLAGLESDAARGRSILDLVHVGDLLAESGALTYGTREAPCLTYGSELLWNGERVRQVSIGVVRHGEKRGEEFVKVDCDRATLVFAHRPGEPDVRLVIAERPAVARALRILRRIDRLRLFARRPPDARRPREQRTRPRSRTVRAQGSRAPPGGDSDDDDPAPARWVRPAGADSDLAAPRSAP